MRLEAKLEAWSRGQNLTVMALGGSITDGHGIRGSLEEHRQASCVCSFKGNTYIHGRLTG